MPVMVQLDSNPIYVYDSENTIEGFASRVCDNHIFNQP